MAKDPDAVPEGEGAEDEEGRNREDESELSEEHGHGR